MNYDRVKSMNSPQHHYNFCSRCKGDLEKKSENLLICKKCNFHFYLNPVPCNGLILENSKGELLIIKRKYDPGKGMFDIPGGFVDPDETLEESMIRESKEELNFEPKDIKYLNSYSDSYLFQGVNFKTIIAVFYAKTDKEYFEAYDDVGEVLFCSKEEAKNLEFGFSYIKKAIDDYLSKTGYN